MKDHFSLSDDELEEQFRSCTLRPAYFSHEAHLRLAWIYLTKYGKDKAISMVNQQIKAYAISLGIPEKYNVTVTTAAVLAVYHFLRKRPYDEFGLFLENNPRLKSNFRELINTHYSTDIFKDEQSKISYREPELLPFD